jgi:hypothetical protein
LVAGGRGGINGSTSAHNSSLTSRRRFDDLRFVHDQT